MISMQVAEELGPGALPPRAEEGEGEAAGHK